MTGTDRAAVRLALGLLRRSVIYDVARDCDMATTGEAITALVMGTSSWGDRLVTAASAAQGSGMPQRILRARLALYLRAVLRAEAGDFGRWTETGCGSRLARGIGPPFPPYCYYGVNPGERAHAFVATRRQPPPLWSQAPTRAT